MFTDCLEEVDIVVSFFRNLFIVIFHKKEKAIHNKKKNMYINQQRSLFQSRETIEGNVIDKYVYRKLVRFYKKDSIGFVVSEGGF